jgi:hypothetical protein
MPSFNAFCLKDPTDLFICFAILATGVLALECRFSNLMSDGVYGLRIGFLFFPFTTLLPSFSSNRSHIARVVRHFEGGQRLSPVRRRKSTVRKPCDLSTKPANGFEKRPVHSRS